MLKNFREAISDYASSVKNIYVDYRIRSDILNPGLLTNELALQPSRAWAKDEKYLSKILDPKTKKITEDWRQRPWGIWAIKTDKLLTKNVEEHFAYLLDLLEPRQKVLERYLANEEEYIISFYIWWEPLNGHGSYGIFKDTLERATDLCHYIEFGFVSTSSE